MNTGWGDKPWTTFCKSADATVGRLRGERFAKTMGGSPSNGINGGLGVGDQSVPVEIACH